MSVVRRDPFRDLFALADPLNRFFYPVTREESLSGAAFPAVDIYESVEGLAITAEVPGLAPGAVEVKVENRVLTLSGERKLEHADQREGYHRLEGWHGTFSRSFSLPPTVDVEKIHAEQKNGLLRVFLPRREETKPRQIKVKVEA